MGIEGGVCHQDLYIAHSPCSFYLPSSSSHERAEVERYHANFVQAYPGSAPVPLMVLDLQQPEAPFALATPTRG